jgi:hypothetical protein
MADNPAVLGTPVSLFHTATGVAYADLEIDQYRETWPIRSKQFRAWLRRRHYERTGEAMGLATIRSILDLLEARAHSTLQSVRSTSVSPDMKTASIWISRTIAGELLRSDPMDGAS